MAKKVTIREKLEKLGWYYGGTGGNCDGYFFNIEADKDTHFLMTEKEMLIEIPTKENQDVIISVFGDAEHTCYNATYIACKLKDILTERITFHKT